MFRKRDSNVKCSMFSAPEDIKELVMVKTPVVSRSGLVTEHVNFEYENYSKRSNQVLRPDEVNMSAVIASGTVISPANAINAFDITDQSVLDDRINKQDAQLYEYLLNNRDAIVEQLKGNIK